MTETDSHDLLVRTASSLFRRKGYAGVGLAEILEVANLPKGSLYHHFPGGKRELAVAATRWAGGQIRNLLNGAFTRVNSFPEGAIAVCDAIAGIVSRSAQVPACPVMSILQAGPQEPVLRETAREVYREWTECLASHAERLGEPDPSGTAVHLHMLLQGAWILAYAEQSAGPFEALAAELRARHAL